MHKNEEDSRPGSRRNSASLSRRNSVTDKKTNPPTSSHSTPKKTQKTFDFVVTGKQILKKSDRASSLPGTYHRRQSVDSLIKSKRLLDSPKRLASQASRSRDASIDDELSLELSQVSDFEDTNSKYGINKQFTTSTPKKVHRRLIHHVLAEKTKSVDSRCSKDSSSLSRDSFKSSSPSPYRHAMSTELECSSGSPTSAPSSGDSAQGFAPDTLMSSRSQDLQDSCCVSTWQDSERQKPEGEWGQFWANYNNSLARVPVSRYYDQCPTPYRTEDIDVGDFELLSESVQRSPENINNINNVIRNEGLHLTPRETQNIIKCAHILGNVLTKAIERQSKEMVVEKKVEEVNIETDPEKEIKKKSMSLNLKETVLPLEVKEEKRWESVPTQTDISLPNTKSAPKIFEKILRQLSKSSLDDEKKILENPDENQEKDLAQNEN
ncbi:uncharacterized protein LOC123704503 [Colias croceus]|uniref:uncharacterized protein LOC123704503 n=1 Tax=Colias crocea TaxID=72248 RepID=UPI001E28169D|nr:uncharacterized protein LOC123704503 [Colias croceus]